MGKEQNPPYMGVSSFSMPECIHLPVPNMSGIQHLYLKDIENLRCPTVERPNNKENKK